MNLDFDQEIDNHLQWIDNVATLLNNENLDADEMRELTRHDHCSLGQWMASSQADTLRQTEAFRLLEESHQHFHHAAGDLVVALQQDNEQAAMQAQDRFLQLSQQVVEHLALLREKS
jgi:hypothetical protein